MQPINYNKSVMLRHSPYHVGIQNSLVRSQNPNLNQSYPSYKLVREQITDKLQEFVLTLDNPNSSINRFIKGLKSKYGIEHTQKFTKIINQLYQNIDKVMTYNGTDSYEFFTHMKDFNKNINGLLDAVTTYLSTSDAIDEFNPAEANYNLVRFVNDFNVLDKAESSFPKSFRGTYVHDVRNIANMS